jgi:cell division protein FtsZ
VSDVNNQYHEELLKHQDAESIVENTSEENEISFSQEAIETPTSEEENSASLKEFGVDTEEPDLFNNDSQSLVSEDLLETSKEDSEEDDLEIPAFLRRQKN